MEDLDSPHCSACSLRQTVERNSIVTFIAAPFGNWIKHKNAISVTGTWTLEPRGNRLWSVVRTLRYDFKQKGWTNRLQLPNPGIVQGLEQTLENEVLSIAEVNKNDFRKLIEIIPESQSVELNLSCPNLGTALPWDSAGVFAKYRGTDREWCIAKVGPLTTPEQLEFLIDELGFRQVHFSNTLPLGGGGRGGLSGVTLRPYTLELIKLVRENWGDTVTIIAGGGVSDFGAVYEYLKEGANHVSLGSVCFNPFKLRKILKKGNYEN